MVIEEEFEKSSIEVLHRDKARIASVVSIDTTPRVEKLRNMYQERRYSVSIEKMRIETRVMKETEGDPIEIRRAKVFAAVVRELPISIFPNELIVGCHGINPRIRYIDPEELEAMEAGKSVDRYSKRYNKSLTDDDWRVLREEIIPYWKGEGQWEKTRHGRNHQLIPPEIFNRMVVDPKETPLRMSLIYTPWYGLTEGSHIGHNSVGYKKVLEKGF
ncbi:MAG: pyruvate formate lyase family protein, partial [Candidatus Kariarchaeaceae archaeon]